MLRKKGLYRVPLLKAIQLPRQPQGLHMSHVLPRSWKAKRPQDRAARGDASGSQPLQLILCMYKCYKYLAVRLFPADNKGEAARLCTLTSIREMRSKHPQTPFSCSSPPKFSCRR